MHTFIQNSLILSYLHLREIDNLSFSSFNIIRLFPLSIYRPLLSFTSNYIYTSIQRTTWCRPSKSCSPTSYFKPTISNLVYLLIFPIYELFNQFCTLCVIICSFFELFNQFYTINQTSPFCVSKS